MRLPPMRRALFLLLVTGLAAAMTVGFTTAPLTGSLTDAADDLLPLGADRPAVTVEGGVAKAGVATRDVSWHLGASGGQFSETAPPITPEMADPHLHATRKRGADGIASRVITRALVVEGAEGNRIAVVANDLYLPNDLLNRRVAQLIEEHDLAVTAGVKEGEVVGIGQGELAVTVSHNHNSAFYSTPAWGTWIFQDVFDLRFFEYYAERMAEAVIAAAGELRPVRMGAATVPFNEITSHTYGPKVGYDGTPAGQPYSHTTGMMSIVRFDDVSDPANPEPYILWNVFGVHPEWTWGYELFNGDITHAAMRIIDRELGVTTVMSQRETGASGPHKDRRVHEPEERREFQDNGFEQLDHGARLWADAVAKAYKAIETPRATKPYDPAHPRTEGPPIELLGFVEGFTVDVASERFAPPMGRPVPGISNCNTSQLFHGNPQSPIFGFPDCENFGSDAVGEEVVGATPIDEHQLYEDLKAAGVPIPETYTATAFTAVEETAAVHIMAMRLGDLGVTFCPCEQFTDTAINVQTRLDRIEDNLWRGWDWTSQTTPAGREWCVDNGDGTSTCADPRNPANDLPPVRTIDVERMLAQINNDAAGWEDDVESLWGEAESFEPEAILGNFTHDEQTEHGYGMVVSVGMANDYFGYVPNYREMRAHDHYRKALNGLGPHGADYLANRMVALGASLNGGPAVELSPRDLAYQAEAHRADTLARTMGHLADAYVEAYTATLPADTGPPAIVEQPIDVARFGATHVRWQGGSNYGDIPDVTVERQVGGEWEPFGDMHGEVQVRLDFPTADQVAAARAGQFDWVWTAAFEAFSSDLALPDLGGTRHEATPPGTYRFVIDGTWRPAPGGAEESYSLTSEPFEVSPWSGITLDASAVDADTVDVVVGPTITSTFGEVDYTFGPIDYPDAYDSPFWRLDGAKERFTYGLDDPSRHQFYCRFCRFRPWADTGEVETLTVTLTDAAGTREVTAEKVAGGRFRVTGSAIERVEVAVGGARDATGNVNGAPLVLDLR